MAFVPLATIVTVMTRSDATRLQYHPRFYRATYEWQLNRRPR